MASTEVLFLLIGLLHFCLSSSDKFTDYQMAGLREHNGHRWFHNSTRIRLHEYSNDEADRLAKISLKEGRLEIIGGMNPTREPDKYFTNGYMAQMDKRDVISHVRAACDQWYAQCDRFNFTFGHVTYETRAFGIMVTERIVHLGIGVAQDNKTIVVLAHYESACSGAYLQVPKDVPWCGALPQHPLHLIPILLELAILISCLL